MRSVSDSRKRWNHFVTNQSEYLDLRNALKGPQKFHPCEDGLRSICWKSFLLYDNLDRPSWSKKLSDSRSVYTSLREHFLKYIEHPDDLESTGDPLTEETNSPWQSLREDESLRAEIFQDVERCLQENYFFREPSTQRSLLDILFIYSKLNPDIGYRQGMHELLAPILWVVERDAIDVKKLTAPNGESEYDGLMLKALDARYVEHDTFALFCVIMQTAKSFYELGSASIAPAAPNSQDTSPIVKRSRRIHQVLLRRVDPELADHLQAIEVLPQIFLIRWIRLLFGREFPFEDVLTIWDALFAEKMNLALIDSVCVAMLLRIRWQLLQADYSSALTLLLRYPYPDAPYKPPGFVEDSLLLQQNPSRETGSSIISKYSGRTPKPAMNRRLPVHRARAGQDRKTRDQRALVREYNETASPGRSPSRLASPQKGLETLFQVVSGSIQRRTEAWNVAKAVRGAVTEVRRNVQGLQTGAFTPRPEAGTDPEPQHSKEPNAAGTSELAARIQLLEDRNKALAKMLEEALESLRSHEEKSRVSTEKESTEGFDVALARIQFVQVYLEDSTMPIPNDPPLSIDEGSKSDPSPHPLSEDTGNSTEAATSPKAPSVEIVSDASKASQVGPTPLSNERDSVMLQKSLSVHQPRPSLAQSSFSWMLGENRHRSSFVSSASVPPEQERRGSDAVGKPAHLFGNGKGEEGRKGSESEEDGFTLKSLRGMNARR